MLYKYLTIAGSIFIHGRLINITKPTRSPWHKIRIFFEKKKTLNK